MRFEATVLFTTLAVTGLADRMVVRTRCPGGSGCDSSNGIFYTDFGSYAVNANEGCRGTNVPHMKQLCVDWRRERAHFQFYDQGKRCLLMTKNGGCGTEDCALSEWSEVGCGWKALEQEDEASGTQPEITTNTTTDSRAV